MISSSQGPKEALPEVLETGLTDPVVIIESRVALVEHVGVILHHELGPAEIAVVVVPLRVLGVGAVSASNQAGPLEVLLLAMKPPI